MIGTRSVTEGDLHAYFDGLLDDSAVLELVEVYLAENPSEAKRLEDYAAIESVLRVSVAEVIDEPIPEAMLRPVFAMHGDANLWRFAAGIALIAIGAVSGWYLRGPGEPLPYSLSYSLVNPAVVAHMVYVPEVRHPVEVTAEEESHLAAWLTKRLGADVRIPQLQAAGYHLVGGRLLPTDDGSPAAQFMYESRSGQRLTLYVRDIPAGETQVSFRYELRDGVGVFYWIDTTFAYALSGEVAREQLLMAARLAYGALNP